MGAFQAARAIDKASDLSELVSTAAECAVGRLTSRFCPLIVADAERTQEKGLWRIPGPGLPLQARYAAIPAALLLLFSLLPASERKGHAKEGDLTAGDVLGASGEGESLSLRRGRRARVAVAAGPKRMLTAKGDWGKKERKGAGPASAGEGGKGASEAGKGPGRPARAFGAAEPATPRGSLFEGEAFVPQDKASLAAMIEEFPRYAGVIGKYFGKEER